MCVGVRCISSFAAGERHSKQDAVQTQDNTAKSPPRSLMRAVRLDGPELAPHLERVPIPRPRDGEALLRVLASGVCHTELQLLDGTLNAGVWPVTPGHEIVGEVVEGPLELVGQRVLVYYSRPCGECDWCAQGQEQVCPNAGAQPGLSMDGGFAEFVRVPVDCLVALPDGLDPLDAAPLGCAAATAYHALHGVAGVQAGQTLVVYGIGGVGLPLIQLARAQGARVLAIGRSAGKLALACQFGAEPVDASAVDPVLEVRRLTHGIGAHTVFELVASEETIPAAVAMLRRQGRLVFVGYGSARVNLNPLELVLRETQLLSSLGNTRAELREVVRLAAAGALRVPLAGEYALEDAAGVLEALRQGCLNGRAVLTPSAKPRLVTRNAERAKTAARPPSEERARTAREVFDGSTSSPVGQRPLEDELMAFVRRGLDAPPDDLEFEDLALRLFNYQFANNRPYRLLCERRGRTPATVAHWREIPAVPIAAFKETLLAAEPIEGAAEFNSSGTTQPERKSRHFHPSLTLYNLNAQLNFKAHVLPDRDHIPLLVLFPPRHELPNSSLAHWLTLTVERFGAPGSDWFISNASGLNGPRIVAALRTAEEAVGVLAASFGLVHLLEYCQEHRERVILPQGSRVMDTGGYKGRSREYAKDELYDMVSDLLGVPPSHIVNMYGMTEHGTQFLDAVLRDHLRRPTDNLVRYKTVPPWARTLVVDPDTLIERPPGERGLLLHFDLINRASALAVLTEDVGHTVGAGFELLGRAQGSEARGCSIALDELIEAVRGGAR
jgi:D-arabinose 1-dehydrogenase-like Zn-dependent alcohol dehydrogenase